MRNSPQFPVINALAVGPDGLLYVAGVFKQIGGQIVNGLARFDGTAWQPIGRGINPAGSGGRINSIAFAPDSSLYVGGYFYAAGDSAAENVARWNGQTWSPVGEGVRGDVNTLAVSADGTLYVGGRFTYAGHRAARNVAYWGGDAWKPLAGSLGNGTAGEVEALTLDAEGAVVVAGTFTEAGGIAAVNVARWNGTAWSAFSEGLPRDVNVLVTRPNGRVVAGWGRYSDRLDVCCLSEWTGTVWRPVSGSTNGPVTALVAEADGNLLVGGDFSAVGDRAARSVAQHSDERGWTAFGSGFDGIVNAFARGPGGLLYAGGSFRTAGSVRAVGIASWDGHEWAPVGDGLRLNEYSGSAFVLKMGPDGQLYVGGAFETAGRIASRDLAVWDGQTWHSLGNPLRGTSPYRTVSDIAFSSTGDLYIGGGFLDVVGRPARHVARWDGTQWSALGGPFGGGVDYSVYTLAFRPDGTLYVSGSTDGNPSSPTRLVSLWDGSVWRDAGVGMLRVDGPPAAGMSMLTDIQGQIVLGGQFVNIGGVPANNVARWDGQQWAAMGAGFNDRVDVLHGTPDGRIFAGGRFTEALDAGPGRVAVWNGSGWQSYAGGVDGIVRALDLDAEGNLFIGGGFLNAGAQRSPYITRLSVRAVGAETEPPATTLSLSVAPNPARSATTLTATHPAGPFTLDVFDALGRHVAHVLDGEAAAGEQRVALDTSRFAPGVYVVRLTASRTVTSTTLVVAR